MAVIAVTEILQAGVVDPSLVAANAGGDTLANDGRTFLKVDNASGGALTLEFGIVNERRSGGADPSVSVGAGVTMLIGPFETGVYNNSSGVIDVSYAGGVTSLTVAGLKV